MKNLRLEITPSMALSYVQELRDSGLVQGVDFDFSYFPTINDRFSGPSKPAYVLFHFYSASEFCSTKQAEPITLRRKTKP